MMENLFVVECEQTHAVTYDERMWKKGEKKERKVSSVSYGHTF